jgi:hypothetical protein
LDGCIFESRLFIETFPDKGMTLSVSLTGSAELIDASRSIAVPMMWLSFLQRRTIRVSVMVLNYRAGCHEAEAEDGGQPVARAIRGN